MKNLSAFFEVNPVCIFRVLPDALNLQRISYFRFDKRGLDYIKNKNFYYHFRKDKVLVYIFTSINS